MDKEMRYALVHREGDLGDAFEKEFRGVSNVDVIAGDITRVTADAIVSPANSFGFMDGGLDFALSEKLGWHVQDKLQNAIKDLPMGELLIGQAIVISTENAQVPFLISAPTMRVPMNFNIGTSVNAYLAMKAILIAAKGHPDIESVAIPGLCTGVGRMPAEIAAHQMYMAYAEIELGKRPCFESFGEAQKFHWLLNRTGMIYV